MASNLPPGCSESDIPGCRPMDMAIDKAIDEKQCIACKWLNHINEIDGTSWCDYCRESSSFDSADLDKIQERMLEEQKQAEERHCDD